MELAGWGGYPKVECELVRPRTQSDVVKALANGPAIARGMGRAYGDSALSRSATIDMTAFNRMLAFDSSHGLLSVEAGVVLRDIIRAFLPRGWFPSVVPGTMMVTVGGMIAADVHGKNHHKHGSFGNFVDWIEILGPEGSLQRCSRAENKELFAWTIGGMGLTGIILRAGVRLRPVESGWIRTSTVPAPNLESAMRTLEETNAWTYSVAWIDCMASGRKLGRSLLMLGEHARRDELDGTRQSDPFATRNMRSIRVPGYAPSWALNSWSVRAFNWLYYWQGCRRTHEDLVGWRTYFFPLDALAEWNRIYGRRGFAQFQCVLPLSSSLDGLTLLLRTISAARQGSFLAVLKRFGKQESRFSFPMEGYTLALDFPVNARSLALLDELDRITIKHGGRFYLAKDARMTAETLRRADSRVAAFRSMRQQNQLRRRFCSVQSERLDI